MREKINRLAIGMIEDDIPQINISPLYIDSTIKASEIIRVEIHIDSINNIYLKGLAYSSNYRVKVLGNAFGGIKNQVFLEVDAGYLNYGDSICGEIYLVTNAGDKSISYKFRVINAKSNEILNSLKRIEDFTIIAKEDFKTALRIFEYRDFINIPFMEDIRLQAMYKAFFNKINKESSLENFLIAIGAKKPAAIILEKNKLALSIDAIPDKISFNIKKKYWGYISYIVKTDASYIELDNKYINNDDFESDELVFEFRINKNKLLKTSHNTKIIFESITDKQILELNILREENAINKNKEYIEFKKTLIEILRLRLEYECRYNRNILGQIIELLESVKFEDYREIVRLLFLAEAKLLDGFFDEAKDILDEIKEKIVSVRGPEAALYIALRYLECLYYNRSSDIEELIRLMKKHIDDGSKNILFYYIILSLDSSLSSSPALLLEFLKKSYKIGMRSPYIYVFYSRLLSGRVEFLHDLGGFELNAICFGIKHSLISEELILIISKRARAIRNYNRIYYPLLRELYNLKENDEILFAICSILIKGDVRDKDIHYWYEMAVDKNISIAGLFEYYLYTLPSDYSRALPSNLLDYFLRNNNVLDSKSKTKLYVNILKFINIDDDYYRSYINNIKLFCIEQIRLSRIDSNLSYLYRHILDRTMINKELSKVLPAILSAYKIECDNEFIKSVLILYPELEYEEIYNLDSRSTYLPIFTEDAVILFEDGYGNRYKDISFKKTRAIDLPDILEDCYMLYPNHIMLRLKHLKDILNMEYIDDMAARVLENSIDDIKLSKAYKKRVFLKLLEYYYSISIGNTDSARWGFNNQKLLLRVNENSLDIKERHILCETLINMGFIKEAYDMLRKYYLFDIDLNNLYKLCTKIILDKLFIQEDLLIYLSFILLKNNMASSVILDYLSEYFNGSTKDMFTLLSEAIKEHVETYDLEERLIAQMLFVGDNEYIDKTFAWYVSRKKSSELIVKAYFTLKSAMYFLHNESIIENVFEYLEAAIFNEENIERIPLIYQFAITKYYSDIDLIDEEKILSLKKILDNLIMKGYVFEYFKKYKRLFDIPADIINRAVLMYEGEHFNKLELKSRILPYDYKYTFNEFKPMYRNIYISSKLLFVGDKWEYQIYDCIDGRQVLLKEGSIDYDYSLKIDSADRFSYINKLCLLSEEKDDTALKQGIKDYIRKEELTKEIFGII